MGENSGFVQRGSGFFDEIKFNLQSAANAVRGFPAPANPSYYKDQLQTK
jgi:hypothetical protein